MNDDPLDNQVDFSGGVRVKFYRQDMKLHIPVHPACPHCLSMAGYEHRIYCPLVCASCGVRMNVTRYKKMARSPLKRTEPEGRN